MATVNSAGFYAQLTAKNKAIGGLSSGLDTDSLVEALTMGTRNKLAKQMKQKTMLGWKTTAYRSVATTLRNFQTKHISLAAGTNSLKANAFFNTFKGTASSDKITVKPGTGATPGSFTVDSIKQLATNQTFTSQPFEKSLEGGEINLAAEGTDFIGKTLQLQMGNTTKTIKLDTLQGKTGDAFKNELQNLVSNAFGRTVTGYQADGTTPIYDDIIKVNFDADPTGKKGTITLDGGTSALTVKNNADLLGLKAGNSNRIDLNSKISELFGDKLDNRDTFKFSINDVTFTVNASDSINSVMTKINNSTAGVRVQFDSTAQAFVFTSKVTGAGDNLRMQDVEGNFLNSFIGAQSGNSLTSVHGPGYTNASQTGNALSDSDFTGLDLSTYKFNLTIGEKANVTLTLDISKFTGENSKAEAVVKSLNAQIAEKFGANTGVSFELNGDDEIVLKSTKNNEHIKISEASGTGVNSALGLLGLSAAENKAFKLGYDKSVSGGSVSGSELGTLLDSMKDTEYTMQMTIDGQTKTLKVKVTQEELDALKPKNMNPGDAGYAAKLEENQRNFLANKLNAAKAEAFKDTGNASKVTFSFDKANKLTATAANDNVRVSMSVGTGNDLFTALKLGGSADTLSNLDVTKGPKLSDIANVTNGDTILFKLGDGPEATVTLTQDMTVQDFMNEFNKAAGREVMTIKDGKLVLDGNTQAIAFSETSIGNTSNVMESLFGRGKYATELADPAYLAALEKGAGKNAEIVVGGKTLYSSSNTFNVNGTDFEVNAVSDKEITVTVSSDPDDVVGKIKSFIAEYNALVDSLDDMLRETKVAGYEPLTDEQRAEMSEEQIKQWESEAKKGLLYNDSTIRSIMQQMRTELYTKVESAGISLYDIGITTESIMTAGSAYKGNGRLEMTESGEAKLRAMLESNPDSVRELFTNTKDGLAYKLDNIINDATRTSSTNQGSLVRMAGTEVNTGNNTSYLSRQIDNIDKQIAMLKTRLENEYNRYWKKFSSLETAISNLNTQSSWLSNFGS